MYWIIILWLLFIDVDCDGSFLLTLKTGSEFQGNVSLECTYWGAADSSSIQNVSKMSILKEMTSVMNVVVAEVSNGTQVVTTPTLSISASASGNVSSLISSFLRISWPALILDVFDKYVCEVFGFDSSNNTITVKSPEFTAQGSSLTIQSVIDLMRNERQGERNYYNRKLSEVNTYVVSELEQYSDQMVQLSRNITDLYHHPMLQYWPEGSYSLLMPDTGCPLDVAASWTLGYRRFHTESEGTNHNNVSENSHLRKPIFQRIGTDNFFYQHFCTLVNSPGHHWPNGSYCISRKNGSCPPGFHSGSIETDEEDTNGASSINGSLPDGVFKTSTTVMFYCCRSDGAHDEAIELPKLRPFYLYRYNGTCQAVQGLDVTEEEMTVDTEDFSNDDKYENEFHPDGKVNDLIIHLCYYSQEL